MLNLASAKCTSTRAPCFILTRPPPSQTGQESGRDTGGFGPLISLRPQDIVAVAKELRLCTSTDAWGTLLGTVQTDELNVALVRSAPAPGRMVVVSWSTGRQPRIRALASPAAEASSSGTQKCRRRQGRRPAPSQAELGAKTTQRTAPAETKQRVLTGCEHDLARGECEHDLRSRAHVAIACARRRSGAGQSLTAYRRRWLL